MAFIDLGKLKFNWQGTWNSGTAYETDDVVFHGSQTFVATADVASGQAEPQANTSWSLMAAGFNYRGTYASGTTYYLHDVVTYGSALYMLEGIAETGNQTGVDPGSNPGSDNWEQLTPAPAANVMHQIGDMVYRNNANANTRLVITEQAGVGITAQEQPLETYASRSFTYTLNGSNGNVINTAGSIPAVTYSITTKNQRADNYVIDGTDRDGDINWEYDGIIRVNIGDTINFDNTLTHGSHPMAIRVADGGASVTTGTYSGEGTATVSWNTTGVAAGTYYYQCTNHAGMVGQIIVESTENRQGSAGANGTMQVCRGKAYTITLDGLNNGVSYNLFNAAAPQSGTGNAISSGEGNSAPGGTSYSGSPVTFTFTPNETTPDTVYITSAANSNDQVEITVNDLAFVPSWGTAAPDNELILDDSDSSNTFTITTGNQTSDLTWTLPNSNGSNEQYLQTNGSGALSWATISDDYTWSAGQTYSGSALNFTGIPSTAKKVMIYFENLDEPSNQISVRVRVGGADVTSGYVYNGGHVGASTSLPRSTGEAVIGYGSGHKANGAMWLTKVVNDRTWNIHTLSTMNSTYMNIGAGIVSWSSGTLDGVTIFPTSSPSGTPTGTVFVGFK
tara:strand:- start:403 stop:2259 length:1857 start_codon:yes stop_codon:yes gene_type:complete